MAEERGLGSVIWDYLKLSTKDALKPFKTKEEIKASEERFKRQGRHIGRGLKAVGEHVIVSPIREFSKSWDKGMKGGPNALNVQDHVNLMTGLFGLSGSSVGAGVANIGRKEARDAIIQGMGQVGMLKKYKGKKYNPIDWMRSAANKRHRANTRRMLQDVNRLPQEMLDPVRSVKVEKLKDALGLISGDNIKLNPWSPQRGVHTMGHEVHHSFTFGKRLKDLSPEEGIRAKKARMLSIENMAHHRAGTYNKEYSRIGFEAAAKHFEKEMAGLPIGSSSKQWLDAYDRSLDAGLKKMKKSKHYEMADEISGKSIERQWYKMAGRNET